jgi:hypothetical protein
VCVVLKYAFSCIASMAETEAVRVEHLLMELERTFLFRHGVVMRTIVDLLTTGDVKHFRTDMLQQLDRCKVVIEELVATCQNSLRSLARSRLIVMLKRCIETEFRLLNVNSNELFRVAGEHFQVLFGYGLTFPEPRPEFNLPGGNYRPSDPPNGSYGHRDPPGHPHAPGPSEPLGDVCTVLDNLHRRLSALESSRVG